MIRFVDLTPMSHIKIVEMCGEEIGRLASPAFFTPKGLDNPKLKVPDPLEDIEVPAFIRKALRGKETHR